MIRIFVNTTPFYLKKEISILEALTVLGLKIPRFCYHEALSIAGNCRICLVEIDTTIKLVASCAQPVLANMQIFTNTIKVLKTRENIMESILINHPLDCPICDQAGECDLQDQSRVFGGVSTRYFFSKRAVENKSIDSCIKTIMTRCIHCTRCVRFATEIVGISFLGTLNRGRYTEIGSFINQFQNQSEISGNVIDLCPVGALTARPYAFKARPWELRSFETIDLTDGLGSSIFVNLKELEIITILPKNNPFINGFWISNKARFYMDSLCRYRVSSGFLKAEKSTCVPSNELLLTILKTNSEFLFLVNDEIDVNTLRALKKAESANSAKIRVYSNYNYFKTNNYYHMYLTKMIDLDTSTSRCFVLLATNIRVECAIINIKLRIKAKNKQIWAFSFGPRIDTIFSTKFINITLTIILKLLEGKLKYLSIFIFVKSNPIFLIGEALFQRMHLDKTKITYLLVKYNFRSFIIFINKKANTESIQFLNIKSINSKSLKIFTKLITFCAAEDSLKNRQLLKSTLSKSLWLHTHGSSLATQCDYILPITSYFEGEGSFINLEQRPQKTIKCIENNISQAYSFAELITTVFGWWHFKIFAKKKSPLYYITEIFQEPKLFNNLTQVFLSLIYSKNSFNGFYSSYPLKPVITDFYLTNNSSRYSLNMLTYTTNKKQLNNIFFKNLYNQ